jgi:hypothetical protein
MKKFSTTAVLTVLETQTQKIKFGAKVGINIIMKWHENVQRQLS